MKVFTSYFASAHGEQWGSVRHFCYRYLCACWKAQCNRRARIISRLKKKTK